MKIIFAQGNPEPEYMQTRHNLGFSILNALADSLNAKWTDKPKFHARAAEVTLAGHKAILVKPDTFYNETGLSARSIIDFYKLSPSDDFLVVHDDLALPFGTIRVRKEGSDAGNNGIKSLNTHVGPIYTRIRIGTHTGLRIQMDDASFVLAKFTLDESKQLSKTIIPEMFELIDQFCAGTIQISSHKTLDK